MSVLKKVAATGDVAAAGAGGNPRQLYSAILSPAAAVATLDVRDSSGGTVLATLQAAANGAAVVWQAGSRSGVSFASSIHATLTGAGASASFEYD